MLRRETQPDLFAEAPGQPAAPAPSPPTVVNEEVAALLRERLHATLALMRRSERMPWPDALTVARVENGFRFDKDALPPEEGAALWAAFDAEMDRLYATLEGAATA
jgi:hypothetical protein